ncbi:MAG TPA: tripartite tricarboxylate transporter substrate binding protein [Burkholderiales bacterium]|nr:tripartite tricarboxylate transporter substrate binding protein [Burkholderiales bacterium]
MRRTRLGSALVLAVCGTVLAAAASSQTYPVRAIRIIMPYSAGGAGDVQGRILAQRLSESLGQQVVIDNRPGAGSTIGAELAAKSSPDGYTLFWIANTHFVAAAMQKKLAYDPLNDYTPVTQVTSAPNVLVIHPSLPPRTVKELIVLARARPGQLDYASSGNGSTQHLTGALFCKMAGIRMTHIPYRGSGPATSDLLGGQVMVSFPGIASMLPYIRAGRLRALGVSGTKRSAELPAVPTIAEAGVTGYELVAWNGIAAPRALPREIQMKLHGEVLRVLKNSEVQKSLRAVGQDPAWQETPELFHEFLKVEAARWAKLVADSGAQVE